MRPAAAAQASVAAPAEARPAGPERRPLTFSASAAAHAAAERRVASAARPAAAAEAAAPVGAVRLAAPAVGPAAPWEAPPAGELLAAWVLPRGSAGRRRSDAVPGLGASARRPGSPCSAPPDAVPDPAASARRAGSPCSAPQDAAPGSSASYRRRGQACPLWLRGLARLVARLARLRLIRALVVTIP